MSNTEDFLFEVLTEELPPKALLRLGQTLGEQVKERLQKIELPFAQVNFFATPRRLAVFVKDLASATKEQLVDRKGPAKKAAFDKDGKPTQACLGFARSCGVTPEQLETISTPQGEWLTYKQRVPGKPVAELLPALIEQAIAALPIPKRMRWGDGDVQFARPVHGIVMMYGDKVIETSILGQDSGRVTRGHRFMAPEAITIPHAAAYASLLQTEGYVIADFFARRDKIKELAAACVAKQLGPQANALISSEDFLNEVTGLVEWPVALCGSFAEDFLMLPEEVLISSMEDHQRYFPVYGEQGRLLPNFITISNIESHDSARVVHGNERVLRARLADAAFFYQTDEKERLEQRVERLRGIVYMAKLGTLYDKTERISQLAAQIAKLIHADGELARRAGLLAKADLTTNMVGEFPELQGVMGGYYAMHDKEPHEVAMAIVEHYLPRFASDKLACSPPGQALALADRIDTLVGAFGINQIPTGDKDPYGLRRAAVGIIRTLVENRVELDLSPAVEFAIANYKVPLENTETQAQVLNFIMERLRSWYQDQGVTADVFNAVAALAIYNPLDIDKRIKAVQTFKKLAEAATLSIANKRVSNILDKNLESIVAKKVDPQFFDTDAERKLATQLEAKSKLVAKLSKTGNYEEVLLQLAELRKPIDDFFDQVLVMTEDKPKRENRLLLLKDLRTLFLQVADIALLQ